MIHQSVGIATFVMPYYGERPESFRYLERSVASLHEQTHQEWYLVIVDDCSPRRQDRDRLGELANGDPDRIFVLQQQRNRGQGTCRNIGVRWAGEHRSPIVLFQDADDVAHPYRLELTRQLFAERPDVDFVYSPFSVIDESDEPVAEDRLTPSVQEITISHRKSPVEGPRAWIPIGLETGYTTLTSTVSVRTQLALRHPFPDVRGSEDGHTWLRMSAGGSSFGYLPSIPACYRIPQRAAGSSDRSRIGSDYYRRKAEVDTDGFLQAMSIALSRDAIDPSEVAALKAGFLRRLALTMEREGLHDLASEILGRAHDRSREGQQLEYAGAGSWWSQ